ncbi:MAG: cysteine--tRNA ligase, partial [Bacteroidetes bacterium QH_2_63_10]
GWGYPGWHIECSVMGMQYLGDRFDLHTGGEDLIFPHHECEIAQNQALAGHRVVNYWVHTRFLQVEGEKMSKSTGNFYTVRDLINPGPDDDHVPDSIREQGGVDPLALRYALMQGQYRKPFNFTLDTLHTAARHVRRYQEVAERVDEALEADADGPDELGDRLDDVYARTLRAMCDDLNTPAATAAALEGVKVVPPAADVVAVEHPADAPLGADHLSDSIDELLAERESARSKGEYDRADAIRDTLEALGIEVMDRPAGTEWRRKGEL